jgi:hypothetical protein
MLKAHALLSALIISLIISIILSSLLLLHYQSQKQWIKYEKSERLQRNLQSATNIVLGDTSGTDINGEEVIDLFGKFIDSISIKKNYWGAYNFTLLKSFSANNSVSKLFFYGTELLDTLSACLYLVDHQTSLQITGSTKLKGDVYLPKAGIKSSYIDGKGYEDNRLYYGNNLKSDTFFSFTNKVMVENMYSLLQKSRDKIFLQSNTNLIPDSIINSFENESQVFTINQQGVLNGNYIKGNVILISDSMIQINSSNHLEDVIVIAPEIIISDDFNGSVQLISDKIITIGKRCNLNYPSSIILLKDTINNYQGKIEIGDSSRISGILFANASSQDILKNIVILRKGTFFQGCIFVNGYVQPEGQIFGSVITDFFLYKSSSATYINLLANAVIDRTKLSVNFVISTLLKKPGKLKIIKWVN